MQYINDHDVFSITSKGKDELKEYLDSDDVSEVFKSDFLMKLFFGDNFSRQWIIKLIHNEIRTKGEQINQLKIV